MTLEALLDNGSRLSTVGIFVWFVLKRAKMHIEERAATQQNFREFLEGQGDSSTKVQTEIANSLKELAVELGAMRAQNTTEHGEILHRLRPLVKKVDVGK